MSGILLRSVTAALALFAGVSLAQDARPAWDGLVDVKTGRLDLTFTASFDAVLADSDTATAPGSSVQDSC